VAQELYKLPEGWAYQKLQEVVDILDSQRKPINNKERENRISNKSSDDLFPYFGATGQVGVIDDYLFDEELLLLGEDGVSFYDQLKSKAYIINGKTWVNNHAHVLRAITGKSTNKFICYYLNCFDYRGFVSGATRLKLNQSSMRSIQIPLPPLNEQKRIDTAITHLQQTLELSKALFASALDEAFQGTYSKNSVEKLSKLTSKIGSGATPKGGQKSYKTEGISLIRSLNVHDAYFKEKGLAYIDDTQASLLSNVEVKSGDVLLNITGASVARSCVVPDEYLPARVNQHVSILRPKDMLNSVFLNYLIISPSFKNDLFFQGAGGATRQALTKTMLQNLDIPIPSIDEQKRIVVHLNFLAERTQTLETSTQEKINDFTALKASLLDAAFKGQL